MIQIIETDKIKFMIIESVKSIFVYISFLFLGGVLALSSCKTPREAPWVASACWNVQEVQQSNMKVYMAAATISSIEYQAVRGWELNPATQETATLYCDIDDDMLRTLVPEHTLCIKVCYLDKGYGGFALCYKAQGEIKRGEYVQLHNSGAWMEHTFKLYDALVANGIDQADFVLTTCDMDIMGKAKDRVGIASVRVEMSELLSPYELSVKGKRVGNIFFEDEKIEFQVECLDMTGKHACRTLAYSIINENRESIYTQKQSLSGERTCIELPSLPYGVYELILEMEGEQSYQKAVVDFSHSRRADEINTHFGTNLHFDWAVYSNEDIDFLAELVKDAGYSLVRTSLRWYQMEKSKGEFALTRNILYSNQCLKKQGLKMVGILSQECPLYDTVPYWLENEDKREAYARFCYFMVDALKEYTHIFTYPNEFNLTKGGVHHPENYHQSMDIIKAAYPAIKRANADAFIVSGAVSRFEKPYLEGLFRLGLNDYCDASSIHLYDFIGGPETYYTNKPDLNMFPNTQLFHDLMKRLAPEKQAWITENGWCSYPGEMGENEAHRNFFMCTENEQARWYARSFIINSDPNRADKYFHYSFINNEVGYFNSESNFGIIHSHNHRTPFSAKPAFVTVAAFNDIVGNALFKGNVEELELAEDERNHFAYMFVNAKGEEIACFWQRDERLLTDKKIKTYTYKSDMPYLEIYDMYGNRKVVDNKEGTYTSLYTCCPVYIKGVKEVK
mgnify:CR=1 FL=1